MKIFPDFTWEWITRSCLKICNDLQERIKRNPDNPSASEIWLLYIEKFQGISGIVPQLQAHPQLKTLVPMKSMWHLRWFPAPDYEVCLTCVEKMVSYRIEVIRLDINSAMTLEAAKVVPYSAVADEIYACISKLSEE